MRYQAVELYSGVLRAVGWLLAITTVAGAVLFVGIAVALGNGMLTSMAILTATLSAISGLVGGLGLIALGQLLCVFVDIEANTRTLVQREYQIDR